MTKAIGATTMSSWGIRPGEPIPFEKLKERARALLKELIFWNLVRTKNPEKQKAREKMIELRLEVQKQLDVLVPGWAEE